MTGSPPTRLKPGRRWYQYSVRTLLIVIWAMGPLLGWTGRVICDRVQEARLRADVKEAIEAMNQVHMGSEPFEGRVDALRDSAAPASPAARRTSPGDEPHE